MRGATATTGGSIIVPKFQSTRPMRGATCSISARCSGVDVSIHAPHAGRDCSCLTRSASTACFNPRAPCGARPRVLCAEIVKHKFQSTRPMRGATPRENESDCGFEVSIHAPHAGRDARQMPMRPRFFSFNPRAPCGARLLPSAIGFASEMFQSTRPMRGATFLNATSECRKVFQSTRPMRGATFRRARYGRLCHVSIHAPHAGRDRQGGADTGRHRCFNPRAPCGARPSLNELLWCRAGFQSTRPMRGATLTYLWISFIALSFNPRAPCGARPASSIILRPTAGFNPRAPCGARPCPPPQ